MSSDKILSVSLRPQKLEEVIGLDDVVETVKAQFKSGRVPHFFLITGESGTGKTSISRIIARMLQSSDYAKFDQTIPLSKFDITEINASDKNGVDDIRTILEIVNYKPLAPSLAKIFIYDEAHQLTTPAQNALLKVLEEPPEHAYFILCTNTPGKIIPTVKRRAFVLNLNGLDQPAMHKLLLLAKKKANYKEPIEELENALVENDISSPGLILQACEKFFGGAEATECIFSGSNSTLDTRSICNLVSKGNFKGVSAILKTMTKEDIVMVKICVTNYLKVILLNSGSTNIAKAIVQINSGYKFDDDLPVFIASICIACDIIKTKV